MQTANLGNSHIFMSPHRDSETFCQLTQSGSPTKQDVMYNGLYCDKRNRGSGFDSM